MHPVRRHIRTITALYPCRPDSHNHPFLLVQTYALKPVVMIEIFDSSCSRSLGQSASIRAAIDILNSLSAAGRPGTSAMLCTYRGGAVPRQEYTAVCRDGKWHLQRTRKKPVRNPCRIASAVKRSGICQQTIGCRRFGRNLRFSPAAERCAAEVCTALSVSAQPYLPALRVRIRRDAIHRRIDLLRDLRSSTTKRLKIPEVSERPYAPTPHRLSERSPPSSPIHPGVRMPRQRRRMPCVPGLPAYPRPDCPKRHSRPAGAYEL